MTIRDTMNGPEWILWVICAVMVLFSLLLLSGRGSFLIAGYNTASPEEKARYDEKKLCRIVGSCLLVIALLLFVMGFFADRLPASFGLVILFVSLLDTVVMLVLCNTTAKKK